jgi:hypothetical protein
MHYEGHLVPDAPTSQGENVRVLPAAFPRVAEEQIAQVHRRRRKLYAGEPLERVLTEAGREALCASIADLAAEAELFELGTAIFLDRPLGAAKGPGKIDRTPLVSHVAFSRSIAERRLAQMQSAGWLSDESRGRLADAVGRLPKRGVAIESLAAVERSSVVSLADARRVAADFVLLRTTRRSLEEFAATLDLSPIDEVWQDVTSDATARFGPVLVHERPAGGSPGSAGVTILVLYDARGRRRAELGLPLGDDGTVPYFERGGIELVQCLQVLRTWTTGEDESLVEQDFRERDRWLALCSPDGAPNVKYEPG